MSKSARVEQYAVKSVTSATFLSYRAGTTKRPRASLRTVRFVRGPKRPIRRELGVETGNLWVRGVYVSRPWSRQWESCGRRGPVSPSFVFDSTSPHKHAIAATHEGSSRPRAPEAPGVRGESSRWNPSVRGPEGSQGPPRVGTRRGQTPTPHARALPSVDTYQYRSSARHRGGAQVPSVLDPELSGEHQAPAHAV